MKRQELLQRSSELLAHFVYEVKTSNAMELFDINTIAEDFLIPIFAIVFNSPDLCNQNRIKMNFPAVDLGSKTSRTSIQVTSDSSSDKVLDTLRKFESHSLNKNFDSLYVYVITERQKLYTSKKLIEAVRNLSIDFNPSANILDFKDLAKMFGGLTSEQLESINGHFEAEFTKGDKKFQFRSDLDSFLRVNQQKIEDEKRTKKYIPSVFVETSETKDEVRYFANPMFFYRKIDDDLQRINLVPFNELLSMAKIKPVENDLLLKAKRLETPADLQNLQKRLTRQDTILKTIQEHLAPFSWYGDRTERFSPSKQLTSYWKVFRISIELQGSSIFSSIEDVSKKIKIAQSKIFLVTGMAGQGKTNFICDLIENQFRAFQIPAIFIPARSLNDFHSPNRILSYITNNRFAPDTQNLHDLFTLLNNVAKECQKPFVIAIDGINEVGDLDGFVAELRVFLEALCQYDFIKIIITCRNEFFDHKFAGVFEPQFSDHLHRIKNLRSEMSEDNKSHLIDAYLSHFQIKARFSTRASKFLKNDFILLRIFCEIHERKNIGYVPDIYKGDIFEGYLIKKIDEFPLHLKRKALNSLFKICSQMLNSEVFSQMHIEGLDDSERQIIEQLIGEDIILRREVPSTGLSSLGIENISFTYDELRDFLLAYYIVTELSKSGPAQVETFFEKVPKWPIYEGFFRYTYVLARKQKNSMILALCEASEDFHSHFLNNLSLLSADIQTTKDVERIKGILGDTTAGDDLRKVAWFLFRKREESDHLNICILLDHIGRLDDEGAELFMESMFSRSSDYPRSSWQEGVSQLIDSLKNLDDEEILDLNVSVLALLPHFAPHAYWEQKEYLFNLLAKFQMMQKVSDALDACKTSASKRVLNCLDEIKRERVKK